MDDNKPFDYEGRIRGTLSPLTNRSEMMVGRLVRVLIEHVPGLAEASKNDLVLDPTLNFTSRFIWHFTNLSRIVTIDGLGYALPGMFASKDEILAAFECYSADDPGFWSYLGQEILAMDEPEVPPEARPESELTKAQHDDPNSEAAATSIQPSATKKSRATSGGESSRRKAASSTIMTGTASSASTSSGEPASASSPTADAAG